MIEFETRSYNIRYYKEMPRSAVADYDYGNIRYPSSYNNRLEIYDKIVGVIPITNITIPDDTVESIKQAICETCDNITIDNNDPNGKSYHYITIQVPQDAILNKTTYIALIRLTPEESFKYDAEIAFIINSQNAMMEVQTISLLLNQQEAEALYNALDDPFDIALCN